MKQSKRGKDYINVSMTPFCFNYYYRKIFVGGLSWDTNKGRLSILNKYSSLLCVVDGLKAYFESFGEVADAVVMVDPQSKKPRLD